MTGEGSHNISGRWGRLRWEASRQAVRKRKRASIAGLSEEEAGGTGGQGPELS